MNKALTILILAVALQSPGKQLHPDWCDTCKCIHASVVWTDHHMNVWAKEMEKVGDVFFESGFRAGAWFWSQNVNSGHTQEEVDDQVELFRAWVKSRKSRPLRQEDVE